MMTNSEGVEIWKRGGRVKNLEPLIEKPIENKETPEGALRSAANKLREAAEYLQAQGDAAQKNANEKRNQADELEAAAAKIEGK